MKTCNLPGLVVPTGSMHWAVLLLAAVIPLNATTASAEEDPAAPKRNGHSSFAMFEMGCFFRWNNFGARGLRLSLGYDHMITKGGWLTVGPRLGMLENGGTTALAGLRASLWTGTPQRSAVRLKLGTAFDMWFDLSDEDLPGVLVYLGGETGVRLRVSDSLLVDFPIQIGLLPGPSPNIYVFQVGTQLVASF